MASSLSGLAGLQLIVTPNALGRADALAKTRGQTAANATQVPKNTNRHLFLAIPDSFILSEGHTHFRDARMEHTPAASGARSLLHYLTPTRPYKGASHSVCKFQAVDPRLTI